MRLAEFKAICIAFLCELVDIRSAGIGQPHDFGAFVECFSGCIVVRLPDNLHFVKVFHDDNLRISAGYQQAHVWKFGHDSRFVFFDEMGEHMSVEMVHAYHRDAERGRQAFCKRCAYQ